MPDITLKQVATLAVAAEKAVTLNKDVHAKVAVTGRDAGNWTVYFALCAPTVVLALCEMAREKMIEIGQWPRLSDEAFGGNGRPATFTEAAKGDGNA